jgi:predicted nucleic acid-binding protein
MILVDTSGLLAALDSARHCHSEEVLTLDERHFRVLNANRRPFRLLPADV